MTTTPVKADDDIDELEALASEEKEYLKVSAPLLRLLIYTYWHNIPQQDAEIDRILKAFRLDAYVLPLLGRLPPC